MMMRRIPLVVILLLPCSATVNAARPMKVGSFPQEARTFHGIAEGLPGISVAEVQVAADGSVYARTTDGWSVLRSNSDRWTGCTAPKPQQDPSRDVIRKHGGQSSETAGATLPWTDRIPPALANSAVSDGRRSWLPRNPVVVRDGDGRFWFADRQGVGRLDGESWTLFSEHDGVPFTEFTCASASPDGVIWLGTTKGVVRFDGTTWFFRQGQRWLPGDEVRSIAVAADGSAWIATNAGLSHIHFTESTLADKASYYEEEIDKYNRRTEFGYVIEAHAQQPGDKSELSRHDSDNDGLWTSMYGAGECFAWAATKDPAARRRAEQAFEALRFLSVAPRGGSHPAPRGFIARTVVPTTEPDPNLREGYTLAGQRKRQQSGDRMWRAYTPRWPTTEDGRYYWKSDTSSDELDGHYFFYGLYYDLVADTEQERERVREIVRDNIDHLIAHDFRLHDHAGATRWANYNPQSLNHDIRWAIERGLNSLSMLSYLATAAHVTGDDHYLDVARELRDKHAYHQNVLVPKIQVGIGSGNQSDDEMAFMCYYNLLRYEPDEDLQLRYLSSYRQYWQLEKPELNPFFNFCYAAAGMGKTWTNQWRTTRMAPDEGWLTDSVDTLRRFPLDRFDWSHTNSHRVDLISIPGPSIENRRRVMRPNGKVIPVDECHFNHWNYSPWRANTGGGGRTLACGSAYLLPYYMGLYHGFIAD